MIGFAWSYIVLSLQCVMGSYALIGFAGFCIALFRFSQVSPMECYPHNEVVVACFVVNLLFSGHSSEPSGAVLRKLKDFVLLAPRTWLKPPGPPQTSPPKRKKGFTNGGRILIPLQLRGDVLWLNTLGCVVLQFTVCAFSNDIF